MRFFQQLKFEFSDPQGASSSPDGHKAEPMVSIVLENQPSRFSRTAVWPVQPSLSSSGNRLKTAGRQARPSLAGRFVNNRTLNVLAAIAMLVLLAHGIGLIWLRLPADNLAPLQPLAMEIRIIPVSAPKPKAAPPPPPPSAAKVKPQPKKTQPKPTLKKMPIEESAEFSARRQVLENLAVEQNTVPTTATEITPPAKIEPFIEADISVDYEKNPKPDYPSMARSMGWQGKVLLKVQVSEQGLSSAVEIERSSGYEILDESAVDAIKQWRFNPAKRGETPIASSVLVPIIFTLQDKELS